MRLFTIIIAALVYAALQSCATDNQDSFEAELRILLLGFDEEQVTLSLNGETIYQEYVKISDPSVGVSDGISLKVGKSFSLSVDSKTTSVEESIEISEDTTVLILRDADLFDIQSSSEPLLLD